MCEWAPAKMNGAWPRSAELFRWAQTIKRSWICSLCPPGSRRAIESPLGCLSTCRIRTSTSFTLTILSPHQPSSTMCLQGMQQAMLHFLSSHACDDPWDDEEPCHMFQEERQTRSQRNRRGHNYYCASVEMPRVLGMVPSPSLEAAAGWPCVHLQSQTFLITSRWPWAVAGTAYSSAQLWWARTQMRATAHILELSVNVYSFSKYLLSIYCEPNMRLDIAGWWRLITEERDHLWNTSCGDQHQAK